MAALVPGTGTLNPLPQLAGLVWAPGTAYYGLGTFSIHNIDGYLYTPPVEGQLWPRGDYAPQG